MNDNSFYQVYFNCKLETKEEVHNFISNIVCQNNSSIKEEIVNQLIRREEAGSTLIAEHVMLPHIESDHVKKSQIIFIRLAKPIVTWDYQIEDICLLIVLLLKRNESEEIKKKISLFTRTLADEEYLNRLLNSKERYNFEQEIITI
ncbi:PTS system, nitrogen regulatory IIA component [Gracilibacillus orientalis]|uniref:PTS system, nitrogen regulatory IIA component n=1 Tax=Gracilibacillus orientalis TaxID=334253 RepID=A0A1I4MX31_9BACI|nr:PTS sugar transporter subunit IIA [Gracilibacillus orientalis]SFM07550.1 PTS system, nitrogen regulatory IIA component [Gracilibacillus orientalis]